MSMLKHSACLRQFVKEDLGKCLIKVLLSHIILLKGRFSNHYGWIFSYTIDRREESEFA